MTNVLEGGSERALEDGYSDEGSAADESYDASEDPSNDSYWVSRARTAHTDSQDWFDSSVRRRIEDSMRLFNSEHTRGSKYNTQQYQKRSRLFRPKTRTSVRKTEAAGVAAFFATQDAVTTSPPNPRDKMQRLASDVNSELLNYRLQNDIPWFLTCIGALQDASNQGVVISKQEWKYEEVEEVYEEQEVDELSGEVIRTRNVFQTRTIADHPDIRLRPVENIRLSPASDWRDPINSSPYLIDKEPWFVGDIIDRARKGSGGPYDVAWRNLSKAEILSGQRDTYDPVRQAREGSREDRYDDTHTSLSDHDTVWVHHNYMRINGEDWYWATIGTEVMLSEEPVPVSRTTALGRRPYSMGVAVIETHKMYPNSLIDLAKPLQEELNDIANLRIDNIQHVLSPRYFIKRGSQTDVRSLMRNVPGGVTAMEDPKNDVHIRQIQDTTSSGFQEQDRLSVEFDDVYGSFSQSTVAANQRVTERVGNTAMLGESANQMTEMTIRTFAETWVEETLQQVMELEQKLESDEVVLGIVGQRMGVEPQMVFRMLEMPVKVQINVGFGATNPQLRIQKVALAFQTIASINPQWLQELDKLEVVSEILGAVGYKSAERFFPGLSDAEGEVDPQVQRLMEENQMLKQMVEGKGMELENKLQVQRMSVQSRERVEMAKLEHTRNKDMTQSQLAFQIEQNKWKLAMIDYRLKREQNMMAKQELVNQRIALSHTIAMDERQYRLTEEQLEWQMGREIEEEQGKPQKQKELESANGVGDGEGESNSEPAAPRGEPHLKETPNPGGTRIASPPKVGSDDKAGVIARGRYGGIPFREG